MALKNLLLYYQQDVSFPFIIATWTRRTTSIGTSQNLVPGPWPSGAKTFFSGKKGDEDSFSKKIGGEDLFSTKRRGVEDVACFFSKNKGGENFFSIKKRGRRLLFRQFFCKTWPRYLVSFDQFPITSTDLWGIKINIATWLQQLI